jgi:thymidylate synthase
MDLDDEVHKVCDESNIPTRAISLMWNQRSVDTFLGLPFNIASYGLLLEIIAKTVNMVPDELIGNLGDTHLYENHLTQAGQQIIREPYQLPKLVHMKTDEFYKSLSKDISLFTHLENTDFVVENYQSHPTIKAPLSN